MFKHILLPIDGSAFAARGAKAGVRLAKALGARVTAVYVSAPYVPPVYPEAGMVYVPGFTPRDYDKATAAQAKKALAVVARLARTAGVRCTAKHVTSMPAWRGILKAARAGKCDAIAMASHGRGALGGLLLGSQTARVLSHSRLPVVVFR
jgi:nucleotide-binding universal stress UspA family protein